jgi:hypothetical protein
LITVVKPNAGAINWSWKNSRPGVFVTGRMGRMKHSPNSMAIATVVIGFFVLLLTIYTAAYFLLGTRGALGDGETVLRVYSSNTLSTIFWPGSKVEGLLSGCKVMPCYVSDDF